MIDFKNSLCLLVADLLEKQRFVFVDFFVSGPDRVGESEYKIFEHIKNSILPQIVGNKQKDNCLVIGEYV